MSIKSVAVIAAISTLATSASSAPLIDASDPEIIAALIQDIGYKATLTTDSVGDPMIKSSAQGYDFAVFFYGCVDSINCQAIQFSASFDMKDGMTWTRAEDFNRQQRWVKIYLDESSDPLIEMDYNLHGGVSIENFNDTFDWWQVQLGEFVTYIDF